MNVNTIFKLLPAVVLSVITMENCQNMDKNENTKEEKNAIEIIMARKSVRHPPPLEETENHSPHASQRKPVEEQRKDIQRSGQRSEQHQRKLGHRHREDDELQTVLLLQFRNYLDANQLGNKIAGNLHGAGCRLVIHPEEVEPVEARSRKRLAQRIDQ